MIWSELELRWVLLGLGLLVVLGVFLGGLIRPRFRASESALSEPEVWPPETESPVPATSPIPATEASVPATEPIPATESSVPATEPVQPQEGFAASFEAEGASSVADEYETLPEGDAGEHPDELEATATDSADGETHTERVVSLRLIPREGEELDAERTVRALREAGLQHGPYEIFHYCEDRNVPQSGFSVANLVEPGSFDLSSIPDSTLPGVTFFMVLPGSRDPVERFDTMIGIARDLCQSLDARLLDELGNSWSIQRERFLREELIEYRRRQA